MAFLRQELQTQENYEVMMGVFNKFEAIYRLYHILKLSVTVPGCNKLKRAASPNVTVCNSINWSMSLLDS